MIVLTSSRSGQVSGPAPLSVDEQPNTLGISAGSSLVFVPSLGAYVTPRMLGGGKQMMIGNLIDMQFGQGKNWPLGAALSLTLLVIARQAAELLGAGVGALLV